MGYIGSGGSVEGLGVEIASTSGANIQYAGGIAGYNTGTITACYSTGSVTATANYLPKVGGIAGYNNDASITACWSTGDVTALSSNKGDIVGYGTSASDSYKVSENNVTWLTAQNAMNGAIDSSVGWHYEANSGSDKDTVPLKLKKSSN